MIGSDLQPSFVIRALLISLAVAAGIITGMVAGILARIGGASWTSSIRQGGMAFGGTVSLIIVVLVALHLDN